MTSRSRDVVPLTIGVFFILLGAVLLLDSTGTRSIGIAGSIGAAFGLAFALFGVLAITAALRVRRFSRRLRRTIGHVRTSQEGWSAADAVVSTVVGDIALDLRRADLPPGETELTVLCWLGTIQVQVPHDVGVDVTAQAMVGSVDVLDRTETGLVRDIHVTTEGYDRAERRIRLHLSTFVGELMVVQI